MNVVIVSETPLYPPNSGARLRALSLAVRLAKRHRIACICRASADPEESRRSIEFLGDHGIECTIVPSPPAPRSGPAFYARLAANLASPIPYSVAAHNCPMVREAIRRHAERHPVDLWQFEWIAYADALNGSTRRLVVAHDVVSTIWQRYHDAEPSPLRRWYIRRQWRKFQRYERSILAGATRVVAVSAQDAQTIEREYSVPADVVDNGVDRSLAEACGPRDPREILYLGNLESGPNRDASMRLVDRIFPAVRARAPEARLVIAGRNPPPQLLARAAADPAVRVCANVPDVRAVLARSGMMAVPIHIGSGSRLKILEALAAGLPVVSTRIGAEGLCLEDGVHLAVVEDDRRMAEVLASWVADPRPAQRLAEAGQRLVLERYDWDALAMRLDEVWRKCAGTSRADIPLPQETHGSVRAV